MKPATLMLSAVAFVLVAGAGGLSLVIPLGSEVNDYGGKDGNRLVQTKHVSMWGQLLYITWYIRNVDPGRPEAPAVERWEEGRVFEEYRDGPWTIRTRAGDGPWTDETVWYIRGELVSREAWERR